MRGLWRSFRRPIPRRTYLDERVSTHTRDACRHGAEPKTLSTACSLSQYSSTIRRRTPKWQRVLPGCSGPSAVTHCSPSSVELLSRGRTRTASSDGERRMCPGSLKRPSSWRKRDPRRRLAWPCCARLVAKRRATGGPPTIRAAVCRRSASGVRGLPGQTLSTTAIAPKEGAPRVRAGYVLIVS